MKTRRGRSLTACILLLALLSTACADAQDSSVASVDTATRSVTIVATLHLKAFRKGSPPGHHLLTWSQGRAGHKALLSTQVSDEHILDQLQALGGRPGDTLSEEAWTRRSDPANPAPDVLATGSDVEVRVQLPSGASHRIDDLVVDVDRRGVAWKLAGNRALIPVWKSGCVICLQSCPGSKVANARASMRDLHRGRARFRPSPLAERLGEGARIRVVLRLKGL